VTIKPQQGFQQDFLASAADIVIGGGAAGSGKTFALLLEPCRHVERNPNFGGVFFRRTYPQITNEGGLWDSSLKLYRNLKAEPNYSSLEWKFKSGARIKFSHLQHEKNVFDFQGSEIPFIAIDELTHFSEFMFWYLISRNRSTCGVKPYIRATCNPDPESWVARFLEWYINPDTGFPIKERNGVIRYFTRDNDRVIWGDTKQDVIRQIPHIISDMQTDDVDTLIKSFTFIAGSIYENTELMTKDPSYLANLLIQDEQTKLQLLKGNWKVNVNADSIFDYSKTIDTFTNEHVKDGKRYISADIALHGSDKFVVIVWSGLRAIDICVMEKSDGSVVENKLKELAKQYSVPQSSIIYDADGVGAYLKGYLQNATSFNNGGAPVKVHGEVLNYRNLKTQCFFALADVVKKSEIFFSERVANYKIGSKLVREIIVQESRAIKRKNIDADGKIQLIPKEQMKNILGRSPDFMDAIMLRMFFELKPKTFAPPKVYM